MRTQLKLLLICLIKDNISLRHIQMNQTNVKLNYLKPNLCGLFLGSHKLGSQVFMDFFKRFTFVQSLRRISLRANLF